MRSSWPRGCYLRRSAIEITRFLRNRSNASYSWSTTKFRNATPLAKIFKVRASRLFHKCIAAIGILFARRARSLAETLSNIPSRIFFVGYAYRKRRRPCSIQDLDPDQTVGTPVGRRPVYRYRTISRRFGDSVSYSEQRSLHPDPAVWLG